MADVDPHTAEQLKVVELGLDAEQFLASNLGKYIIERAEAEIESAIEQFKATDPEDAKAMRALQNIIARNESVQYWLADAINAAHAAEEQLQQQ